MIQITAQVMDYFHIKNTVDAANKEIEIKTSLRKIEAQIEHTANAISMLKQKRYQFFSVFDQKLRQLDQTYEYLLMEKSNLQARLVEVEKQKKCNYVLNKSSHNKLSPRDELSIRVKYKVAEIKCHLQKVNDRIREIEQAVEMMSHNSHLLEIIRYDQLQNLCTEYEALLGQKFKLIVELKDIDEQYKAAILYMLL